MGIFAGVLAAVGQAVGFVLSKQALRTGLDPLSATVIRIVAAMVGVWILAFAQRDVRRSVGALRDRGAAAFMVGGAVFGPFLGVTLSLVSLKFIEPGCPPPSRPSTRVTLALSARFHGERMTARTMGGALVACGSDRPVHEVGLLLDHPACLLASHGSPPAGHAAGRRHGPAGSR